LIVDEKDEHILAEAVLGWRHVVLRMAQDARLEDSSQVWSRHLIQIGFTSEDSQQIEDVQEQLSVQRRQ